MYFSHSTTKLEKPTGSKGFIEKWKIDSDINIDIEKVTNIGGSDTIQALKQGDRFLYVIKGIGSVQLMDNEFLLDDNMLIKIPSAKQLEFVYSQVKYLIINGNTEEAIELKGKNSFEVNENTVLYFLEGEGNVNLNGKKHEIKADSVLTLRKGDNVEVNGSSRVLKITEK